MARITKTKLKEAVAESRGNLTGAARTLGVSRQAVHDAIAKFDLRAHLLECRTLRVEKAEDVLDRAVDDEAPWAVSLTLKCLGKHLGYIERIPDVIAAKNLDALRRLLAHLGVEKVDDERLLEAVMLVQSELAAERE